ncbi:MAG: tetraacyldisaccharide 4'-kinase [Planctomycetaceae bacterium]
MNEAAFRELISGEKSGLVAGAARTGLSLLSPFYGAAAWARNRLFDAGVLKAHTARAPVISVGNVTTGGTGKTPLVAWLVHWFHARNIRVSILSRGYRALPGDVNDEKLVLDQLCPGVPHLQQPDRVASAERACREFGSQALILDDGFQHRRLRRDLDIVLVDALNPWGYGHLLPRGLLRERLSGLRRADVIVLTRADQVSEEARHALRTELARHRGSSDCVEVAFVPEKLVNARGESAAFSMLMNRPVGAYCGIGNPDAFRRTLADAGISVGPNSFRPFPDHHHYTDAELDAMGRDFAALGASAIVTTQKDLVKTTRVELAGMPLWGVRIGAKFLAGEELLDYKLSIIADLLHR